MNYEGEQSDVWTGPIDPVVEAVDEMLTEDEPKWTGSASELLERLELDIQPNVLTKKLNVNAGVLLNDYAILYENNHTRNGSRISLKRMAEEATA